MERRRDNGNSDLKTVMAGIRLTLEEIRDLRRDAAEDRGRLEEDRKRAEERFEEYVRRSDERFEEYRLETRDERRRSDRMLRVAIGVVRDFRTELKKQTEILLENNRVLNGIARAVRIRGNGSGGNGARGNGR